MKVLQIITRMNQGGTARWLTTLESGLHDKGIENSIAAGGVQMGEVEDQHFAQISSIRLKHLGRAVSPLKDLKAFFELRSLIKAYQPDLVNTHTSKAGTLGRIAVSTILRNKPIIIHTYHGHLLYGYFKPWKVYLVVRVEKFLAKFTQVLIVSGEKVKNELIEAGIGKPAQYTVLNPGIDTPKFITRVEARTILGIETNSFVIGWLGRITKIKRPELFLDLAKKNPKFIFLMGGDGEMLNEIKNQSPRNLLTVGWSNPELIWGASDIAILTSENEAQPISLVEAGSAGLPLIAFNVGSINGVIANNENGYLVTTMDEMSQAINSLYDSGVIREMFGAAGKRKMMTEFGVEGFINSHIKVYKESIKNFPK
jgi:glycosyltransferase involved in cell wall biosynthesis